MAVFVCATSTLTAQHFAMPIDPYTRLRVERSGVGMQQGAHLGALPLLPRHADLSGVDGWSRDTAKYYYDFTAKLFSEDLIELRRKGLHVVANALLDFSYGNEWRDQVQPTRDIPGLFINSRGFMVAGLVGESVYFYSDFRENQARFPGYLDRFVDSLGVVPGQGRTKPFGDDGYDYNMSTGYVGFHASPWLAVQAGHGKQFIGHGRRSLLLSDNAFNYPFAKYRIRLWEGKVQYDWNIALLQSLDRMPRGSTPESLFQRKYATWTYVSFKLTPNAELGFYEAVTWPLFNPEQGTLPFDVAALNPIPFLHTLRLGLDDATRNALVGINAAYQPARWLRVYGQYMRDRAGAEGYQAGFKMYNLWNRLHLQCEGNTANVGAYSHPVPLQGFTHFAQPLAHPLGSGFTELFASLTYYHNRWYAHYRHLRALLADGPRDPLLPRTTTPAQTISPTDVDFHQVELAYVFNPKTNLQVYGGVTVRNEAFLVQWNTNAFWNFGLRTFLLDWHTEF